MFNDCYTRNKEVVSSPPLPFYLFSVGEKRLLRGETAEMGSLKNSFCELVFGISGVGELTLYDKNYLCNPGDVFYYLPGEEHRHHALSAEWTTRWVCFDGPLVAATLLAYQYPRLQRGTGGLPEELYRTLKRAVSDSDYQQVRRTSRLVGTLLAELYPENPAGEQSSLLVKQCMEWIQSHLTDPALDLTLLCDTFGVGKRTLTRLFHEKIGMPPGQYIRSRRLTEAQILLMGTDLPVREIARKCGFSCLSSFIRFIRNDLGSSPLAYRRRNRRAPEGAE